MLEVLQMTNCLGLHRQLEEQPRNCNQGNISIHTLWVILLTAVNRKQVSGFMDLYSTRVNSREHASQKLTSTEQDKEKFTNVGSLGQVYNVNDEDESGSADEKIHSTRRKRRLNPNQKTASTDSATEEAINCEFGEIQ